MREPFLRYLVETPLGAVRLLERLLEFLPAQGEQLDVADGAHGRCPPGLSEQAHLAEELPGSVRGELDLFALRALAADRDFPLLDHIEAVGGVALGDDLLVRGERQPFGPLRE